jgi:DNA-binding beta-propeller fold protein YncE
MTVVDQDGKATDMDIPAGAHGVDFAPELHRGFTAGGGKVTIFDLDTLKVISEVDIQGRNTDFIVYDPGSKRFLTMNPRTQDASAVDAKTGEFAGHIALGGQLEAAQPDGTGRVFAALLDSNQVVEFDAKALKAMNTWSIAPCKTPHGMAIDAAHKRLFVGCRDNDIIAVVDYVNHKVVATVPIGKGTDANTFDPGTGLVFSSNGDGTTTIVHEDSPDKYTVVQTLATQKGGRTMALDTKNHNIYIVTAEFTDKDYPGYLVPSPPNSPNARRGPPSFVPDTFSLLSFGR